MQLTFLNVGKSSSTREYYLQQAAARSHAAKFAHKRLKRRRDHVDKQIHRQINGLSLKCGSERRLPTLSRFGSFRGELRDLLPTDSCAQDYMALTWFVDVALPATDVACELFNNMAIIHFFLPNLHDEASYHATMALLHHHLSVGDSTDLSSKTLMLEHRGKAMACLRNRLQCKGCLINESLVLSIATLATLEGSLTNLEACRLHLSTLGALAETGATPTALQEYTTTDMIAVYGDTVSALSDGRSTFQRRPFGRPCSDPPLFVDIQSLAIRLPTGFAEVLRHVPVSQDTIAILYRACELGFDIPCVRLSQEQKVAFARRRLTRKKYLNYLDSIPILLAGEEDCLCFEKLLTLALSLFGWSGFCKMQSPRFGIYKVLKTQMLKRLRKFQPKAEPERTCVAWMWLMLVDAWRTGGNYGNLLWEGCDALRQFLQRYPMFGNWDDVQRLTRLFFWTDDMDIFWCQNWEKLTKKIGDEHCFTRSDSRHAAISV